jgi:hypothetical protein
MRFFDALWAFSYHGVLPENLEGAVFGHSLKTYGWIDLIVAVILFGASVGVVMGSQFSRWIGIIAGAILAVSSIWMMPYYPIWALTYVAIGILVVYGLATYGSRESVEAAEQ